MNATQSSVAECDLQEYERRLAEALPSLRERMLQAAQSVGRPVESVRLVAVTKGHPTPAVVAALAAGLRDLGENRVDELEGKSAALDGEDVRWHMIGNLQRRKVPRVVGITHLIHSVDSTRLAERISRVAEESGRPSDILLQVNTSGEDAKSGIVYEGAVETVHRLAELPGVRVGGLMTMAPYVADEATLRRTFERLRKVLDDVRASTDRVGAELSMGMTNDLEPAIAEGSTMVRVGTALFGERTR